MKPEFKVKCPHCHEKFSYYHSDFRPFCSERCRMVDLGHWLEGNYAVPSQNLSENERATLEVLHNRSWGQSEDFDEEG